jgi:hypothetical protein
MLEYLYSRGIGARPGHILLSGLVLTERDPNGPEKPSSKQLGWTATAWLFRYITI